MLEKIRRRGGQETADILRGEDADAAGPRVRMTSAAKETPAVVVTDAAGRVVTLNAAARRLMGSGVGRFCWQVVGGLHAGEWLPCETGCATALLSSGVDRARLSRIGLGGRPHSLTCVPVRDSVVCALTPQAGTTARHWEMLTAREREVLRLLCKGRKSAEIADALGLKPSTVRTHVEHMREKFAVSTRAALVARAFDLGLLG